MKITSNGEHMVVKSRTLSVHQDEQHPGGQRVRVCVCGICVWDQ